MSSAVTGPTIRIATLEQHEPSRRRSLTGPVSIAIHLAGLAALVLVPILASTELPAPTTGVRAFLVEPPAIAPPPPPPPPAPAAAAARPVPAPSAPARFVAPVSTPDSITPEEGLDLGVEGGVAGGVEGGVEGGVVGGIIGGLPEAPPPAQPLRVGGNISEPKKLRHVAPEYPDLARQARIQGMVIVEAMIGADGRVGDVSILRSLPMLDEAAVAAVKQWVYAPTLLNGIPVPVIMTITVRFSLLP
jgi:periplasmic protein TonB